MNGFEMIQGRRRQMSKKFTFLVVMLISILACARLSGQPSTQIPAESSTFETTTSTQSPTNTPIPSKTPQPSPTSIPSDTPIPCVPSGSQEDINTRLREVGDTAVLCQGAVFELTGSVEISADRQQIYTEGFPEDDRRAVLRIFSPEVTTAIVMFDRSDALLSNLIIDGNRAVLGYKQGEALVFAGGESTGQIIRNNKITEPRSWSALQLIEYCDGALVENNDIGPAGDPGGEWADGISLACTNTIVRNNRIIDATDGAIVVFAAPGSIIENNLIRAESRTLLGGIHLVAPELYGGDYSGTIVQNNIIESDGAVIRIAVPMGARTWLCLDEGEQVNTLFGGTVRNNILRGNQVQYGFIADGVKDWTVVDNIDESTHIGWPTIDCRGQIASSPAGFQYFPPRAEGIFQPEFAPAYLELALWAIVDPVP
jgi:hypothetical protein